MANKFDRLLVESKVAKINMTIEELAKMGVQITDYEDSLASLKSVELDRESGKVWFRTGDTA